MTVASLFNVPTTDDEMRQWSFAHMAHHRDINAAIQQNYSITLPLYILDPVDMNDPKAFLDQHQLMHNNTDQITGVAGFDLSEVNWSDPQQRAGWIYLNAQLHTQESAALGGID
jgi:hypothetical protein